MSIKTYKVLIDTNIYDGANYSFGNPAFSSLQNFAQKGYLSLYINSIIKGEVERHIRERLKIATQAINEKLREYSRDFASFYYDEPYKSHLAPFEKHDMVGVCINRFRDFLAVCRMIDFSANGIDVESIITDYFSQNAPFQESKPDEFKDAITIHSFVKYISDLTNIGPEDVICVVSSDKGFRKGLKRLLPDKSPVIIYDKIDDLLSVIVAQDKRVQALTEYLGFVNILDEIRCTIQEFVENASFFVDDQPDEFYLLDVDAITCSLLWVDITGEQEAIATFDVKAVVKVWYSYVDEDRSFFDKEDWAYLWKAQVEKDETHEINFEVTMSIDLTDFGEHKDDPKSDNGEYSFNFEDDCIEISRIVDGPQEIFLDDETCLESEVTESDPFYEDDGEREYATDTCPECGCPIGLNNDGGNGFCINCAPNH